MNKLVAIDLFAGAGGIACGLKQAGFHSCYANEIDPDFSETLRHNNPTCEVDVNDIRSVDPKQVRKSLMIGKGELDLLAGGPPCQGFSIYAPSRSSDDARNNLVFEYLSFVKEFSPKFVLIENVPGMVSFESGATIKAILSALKSLGYTAAVRILYAAHYGVPQTRWRTVFLASKVQCDIENVFPKPIFNPPTRANFTSSIDGKNLTYKDLFPPSKEQFFVTVMDALGDLPVIDNGGGSELMDYDREPTTDFQKRSRDSKDLYNHECAGVGKANLDRLKYIPQGGSWRDIPFELLPAGMKRAKRTDHTKRYGRLDPKGLGSTILTKCDPHWGTYYHYDQDRIISVREAARIQSFPDSYRFFGSLTQKYKQVGNAVPPILAASIGAEIKSSLQQQQRKAHNLARRVASKESAASVLP